MTPRRQVIARSRFGRGMETGMGELINLNRVRKERARAEAKTTAKTNRAANGLTRADKTKIDRERAAAARLLDGSKLED